MIDLLSTLLYYLSRISVFILISGSVSILSFIWTRNRHSIKFCKSKTRLEGKTVIITGSSAGIGKATANDLASRGAKVIMGCRNLKKAQHVADNIIKSTGNNQIIVRYLDTSLMSSVRSFAERIVKEQKRIDILILNAGVIGTKLREETSEGLELTMATNHFGHFLLTHLLIGLIEPSSRVVVVASQIHQSVSKFNAEDLNFSKPSNYSAYSGYALSKLCNVLFTKYLAAVIKEKDILVNCACPGLVSTDIFPINSTFYFSKVLPFFNKIAGRTPEEGCQTIIHAAICEEVQGVSGGFFTNCKLIKCNPLADDVGLMRKVWEKSEDFVQLTPEECSL